MTTVPRFTVTAIDQSGYIQPSEGTIVVAGATWPVALEEYKRLLREQVEAFGDDTYGPQADQQLTEADDAPSGATLSCSFSDSWLLELRAATDDEYPSAERIQAAGDSAQHALWVSIADAFPDITTGDLDPLTDSALAAAITDAVSTWVSSNWNPHRAAAVA